MFDMITITIVTTTKTVPRKDVWSEWNLATEKNQCSSVNAEYLQELIRRWDSERELLRSVHWKLPEFAEITQNNGHYAVQIHSRSPILVPIESSYTISY